MKQWLKIFLLIFFVIKLAESKTEFRIKFLFADAIFSYNLNSLFVDDHPKQTQNHTTFVSANMLPGSFICFILVRSDLEIKMNGADTKKFSLELENLGSTSVLIDKNKQKTVFKLHSLKLSEILSHKNTYEIEFKLIGNDKDLFEFSSWLTIHVNSTEYEYYYIVYYLNI